MGMNDKEDVVKELKALHLFLEMGLDREGGAVGKLGCKSGMKYIDDAIALLEKQEEEMLLMRIIYGPAIEVVGEVVRCKDCKWHTMRGDMLLCEAQDKPHTYDWFCADGEKR